jgi:transcriptional regulator with XRE-family HTH domain
LLELDRKALGEQLRQLRKQKGLTLKAVKAADLSGATISKIEMAMRKLALR